MPDSNSTPTPQDPRGSSSQREEFEQAGQEASPSLVGEFVLFLRANKAWWMIPILIVLALLAGLVLLGGSGAAPFIYTLF